MNAKASTLGEAATQGQLGAINAIARAKGLNALRICEGMFGCEPHELTVKAASKLIDRLRVAQRNAAEFDDYLSAGGTGYSCQEAWDEAV